MRKLVKDSEGNVAELITLNDAIPSGWEEVPAEELDAEELTLARRNKMSKIRSQRDAMLYIHDRIYLIALKDSTDTTAILADRAILLNLPEDAQTAVDAMTTVEEIQVYDAFAELELSRSYE